MYEVITIVTPMSWALRQNKAIDRFNAQADTTLTSLDAHVLQALFEAKKGLQNKTIMLAVRNRIYTERFTNSLDRLLSLNYIVRTPYRKAVYYTITLQGHKALEELNTHMQALILGK